MKNRGRQRQEPRAVKDTFDLSLEGRKPVHYRPHQKPYADAIARSPTTVGIGPAGTGKTYVAANIAAEGLVTGKLEKVIITRPTIPVDGESLGFLPGQLNNKMAPWTAPIFDVFNERIGMPRTQELLKAGKIEIVPFGFMRGRTFKNGMVLVDEAQNMTVRQARLLVTRHGEDCTYVIDGDLDQSDLGPDNGLEWMLDMIERYSIPIPVIEFFEEDVVRSRMCKIWVSAIAREDDRD